MSKIRLKICYENQDFGYVKMRDSQLYYGYSFTDCTLFNSLEDVKKIINKLHNSYRFIVEVPREFKSNQRIAYRYI